ncbi:flagellin [Bacillus niameyensis]|uniref:flagellin n=1 Tax=Bacillus niameyensis TaxID=1522308 RepID=UPI00389964E6
MNETHSMLQRMRELAVQANNGTNNEDDLTEIQKEITQLNTEITRIAEKTEFNTKTLLDGSLGVKPTTVSSADWKNAGVSIDVTGIGSGKTIEFTVTGADASATLTAKLGDVEQTITIGTSVAAGTELNFDAIGLKLGFSATTAVGDVPKTSIVTEGSQISFQIGANGDTTLDIGINNMKASALGKDVTGGTGTIPASINAIDVSAADFSFDQTIKVIDKAIGEVSAQRSTLGAWQNRLDHTINNLGTSSENLTAAESRIRDVDYALAA